ncbi:hypothetical protein AQUSIP_13040 [Aquicella siphonis]|uniref:Uncharacterized protein n=1 Tax=Aquicella siphonis TaxID=254247 RepID=A0A5E4PHZ5_9COXI|nr:hypothetical protein [Aquicella siphonis]VVC76003.1 hypothetical protein AQUSIP_13040 [Aquicella siphonis]
MKVYYPGNRENIRLYVQPGIDHPETSEWFEGGKPKMFEVHFKNQVAEVDDNIGQYLLDKKLAIKSLSRIITNVSNKFKRAK